jgi:RNA polymerase sigma-70 factor, ECF subfamily
VALTAESASTGGSAYAPQLQEWIRKAKAGDVAAFQHIYELYARKVLNFVYRLVRSPEEAEELTQETFVTVYRKFGTLQDDTRFEPWLFRIARNLCYQRYRNRGPATVSVDEIGDDGRPLAEVADTRRTPEQSLRSVELEAVVERVIAELPEKYREVLVLAVVQQLEYQQIAEIVGRSLASVKTDIHRARLEVRRRVKEYLGEAQT